jgi:hypothetical protein
MSPVNGDTYPFNRLERSMNDGYLRAKGMPVYKKEVRGKR